MFNQDEKGLFCEQRPHSNGLAAHLFVGSDVGPAVWRVEIRDSWTPIAERKTGLYIHCSDRAEAVLEKKAISGVEQYVLEVYGSDPAEVMGLWLDIRVKAKNPCVTFCDESPVR